MSDVSEAPSTVAEAQRRAALKRKRGDALTRVGLLEDAKTAYEEALATLDRIMARLDQTRDVDDFIETAGARGGVLRRLDRPKDALASYEEGAKCEAAQDHSSTYNRLNAIKLSLETGGSTLATEEARIKETALTIEAALKAKQQQADDPWAWADLGDCRALLGDREQASWAYRNFADRAETKATARAMEVLGALGAALQARGDPNAQRVIDARETLLRELGIEQRS